MRIQELLVPAFGPFKDFHLDLRSAKLAVVYGPNEAGKSTLLRALHGWLFGIPQGSKDDFEHPSTQLQVGGRLLHTDGVELQCFRKKGRKLIGPGGQALESSVLAPFLGTMTEELFKSVFGIDHEALVQGGNELLHARGEVGKSLFSAGLGLAGLSRTLEHLETSSREFYVPKGSKSTVNKALANYRNDKEQLLAASLAGEDYKAHKDSLEKAMEDQRQTLRELSTLRAEKARVERLQQAFPKLAALENARRRLGEMGEVRILAPEFSGERLEAQRALKSAEELRNTHAVSEGRLLKELTGIHVRTDLLEAAEELERLREDLGICRKASHDRTKLETEWKQLRAETTAILASLKQGMKLEEAGTLRLTVTKKNRLHELANQKGGFAQGLDQARENLAAFEVDLLEASEEFDRLGKLPNAAGLQAALDECQADGDLEKARTTARESLRRLNDSSNVALGRLGLWSGSLEELEKLPVPKIETVERFEGEFVEIARVIRSREDELEALRTSLADFVREEAEMILSGSVPTEVDLDNSRKKRQILWGLVRRAWLGEEDVRAEASQIAAGEELPRAYEGSVGAADSISDRLRREAARVARLAELRARKVQITEQLAQLEGDLSAALKAKADLDGQWRQVWSGSEIVPLSPREMRAWLSKAASLVDSARQVREQAQALAMLDAQHLKHVQGIRKGLAEMGESGALEAGLRALTAQAGRVLAAAASGVLRREELRKRIGALKTKLAGAQRSLTEADRRVKEWERAWSEAVQVLGLGPAPTPGEVQAILTSLDTLFKKLDEAEGLSGRIQRIKSDDTAFTESVRAIIGRLAPELAKLDREQAVDRLADAVAAASAQSSGKATLESELAQARQGIEDNQTAIQHLNKSLQSLCERAGAASVEDLPALEARSADALALRARIDDLEGELVQLAPQGSLKDLAAEALGVNADGLPACAAETLTKIEELNSRALALGEAIGAQKNKIDSMNGESKAASLAEAVQGHLATVRAGGERYVRLRLASEMLKVLIERYRERNQTPVMSRASEYFSQLTLGSFSGLEIDSTEEEPILVGARPDGKRLAVAEMSEGTRDQLYLSLRLASAEVHVLHSEPFPLIVDDVLVHFDDERTKATLRCLADLAEKTQVLIFTHHEAVRDAARTLKGSGGVKIFELQRMDTSPVPAPKTAERRDDTAGSLAPAGRD